MYIEHPFKYNGVYYAKVDGKLIEITEEQAKVMLSFYRNPRNYEKRWAPKNDVLEEQMQEDLGDSCMDLLEELDADEINETKKEERCKYKARKKKIVLQREMVLDCVFSANTEGLSIQDLPDDEQLGIEQQIIQKMEFQRLHSMISMLSEEDQYIIEEVFFQDVPKVQVAKSLGITPQALNSRLKYIMGRLRRMYALS